MYSAVPSEIVRAVERLGALRALVGPLARVGVDVLLEPERVSERLVAPVALPFAAAHVGTHPLDVPCKVAQRCEDFPTLPARVALWRQRQKGSIHATLTRAALILSVLSSFARSVVCLLVFIFRLLWQLLKLLHNYNDHSSDIVCC